MYSNGSYSSHAYSAGPSGGSAFSGEAAIALHSVKVLFSCDAEIQSNSDFGDRMKVTMSMECDAELAGGIGGVGRPTRPTGWTAEAGLSKVWVPERPITGT